MVQAKKLLFSVTAKDFTTQTFSVGGAGGGGKDTSNSGVRLIHEASGARGEGREHRSVTQNKRAAFRRLVDSEKFRKWLKVECSRRMGQRAPETPEQIMARVDQTIAEGFKDGSVLVEEF
jgi:protein subunit release factor A